MNNWRWFPPGPSLIGPRSRVLVSTVVLFVSQIFRPRRSYYLFPYRPHIRPTISSTELHLHKLEKAMYNACQTYVQICQSTAFFWNRRPIKHVVSVLLLFNFNSAGPTIMQYSRAGLFALLFTLIVSLVSAVPIPSTESTSSSSLSSRKISNLNGQDRPIELDAGAKNPDSLLRGRMSTLPLATKLTSRVRYRPFLLLLSSCIYLTFVWQQFPTDTDEQLVRRSKIGDKIKHAFQVYFNNFFFSESKILIICLTIESWGCNQERFPGTFVPFFFWREYDIECWLFNCLSLESRTRN